MQLNNFRIHKNLQKVKQSSTSYEHMKFLQKSIGSKLLFSTSVGNVADRSYTFETNSDTYILAPILIDLMHCLS